MQVGGKCTHFGLVFEGAGQQVHLLMTKEGASEIKHLGTKQGKRPSCFEHPGGEVIKMITLQKSGPTRPFILRLHRYVQYSIILKSAV